MRLEYLWVCAVACAITACSDESAQEFIGLSDDNAMASAVEFVGPVASDVSQSNLVEVFTVGTSASDIALRVERWTAALSEEPSADVSNRSDLLATLFELNRNDVVFEIADVMYDINQRLIHDENTFQETFAVSAKYGNRYLCAGGGDVATNDESRNGLWAAQYLFNHCKFGDIEIDGFFNIREHTINTSEVSMRINGDIAVKNASSLQSFTGIAYQFMIVDSVSGSYTSSFTGNYAEGIIEAASLSDVNLDELSLFRVTYGDFHGVSYTGDSIELNTTPQFLVNSSIEVSSGDGLPVWSVIAPLTDGLRGVAPGDVTFGSLKIKTQSSGQASEQISQRSSQQAQLLLLADNGDANSFDLMGISDDGSVGSSVYQWGDDLRFDAPRLFSEERAERALVD